MPNEKLIKPTDLDDFDLYDTWTAPALKATILNAGKKLKTTYSQLEIAKIEQQTLDKKVLRQKSAIDVETQKLTASEKSIATLRQTLDVVISQLAELTVQRQQKEKTAVDLAENIDPKKTADYAAEVLIQVPLGKTVYRKFNKLRARLQNNTVDESNDLVSKIEQFKAAMQASAHDAEKKQLIDKSFQSVLTKIKAETLLSLDFKKNIEKLAAELGDIELAQLEKNNAIVALTAEAAHLEHFILKLTILNFTKLLAAEATKLEQQAETLTHKLAAPDNNSDADLRTTLKQLRTYFEVSSAINVT